MLKESCKALRYKKVNLNVCPRCFKPIIFISSGAKRKIHSWIGIAKKLQFKKLQVHVYVLLFIKGTF